uniref:tryptophan--tRNA ligase n=1 Tax=Lygus hesperus TaxID=30085 RepID=A0A0A9X1F5_LYGHE
MCFTPLSWLQRMTQFKDKSQSKHVITTGLLCYPVLMAADILLHHATIIPVGEDQVQHLELCNAILQRIRALSPSLPSIPKPLGLSYPNTTRIMNLRTPTKKMSKSDASEASRILLTDSNDMIRTKIQRATTDSEKNIYWDRETRPGVSN